MKKAVLSLLTCAAAALATNARADEGSPAPRERPTTLSTCDRVGPKNAISTQPFSLFARGVMASYERLLIPRVSLVGIAGYRAAAQGDYDSSTIHGGLEGRVWIRPSVDIKCGMYAMSGPFAGLRLGVGYTRLEDEVENNRFVGSSVAFSPTANLGWRFVLYRVIEITPSLGLGVRADLDPPSGLVSAPRPAIALNLSVGWMF